MSTWKKATDYRIETISVDGNEIKGLFFALEFYETIYSSAVTGNLVCVETTGNPFLYDKQIEGSEKIDIMASSPQGDIFFSGYINKISNRNYSSNGQITYVLEFTSSLVRENESKVMTERFKETNCEEVVDKAFSKLTEQAEIPIRKDKFLGAGEPMNFLASGWKPVRVIDYVLKHGQPGRDGGGTTEGDKRTGAIGKASGKGGFYFFETIKGCRYGTASELLEGRLGTLVQEDLKLAMAPEMGALEETKNYILEYHTIQNNDTQSQMRIGAYRSRQVAFDLDSGFYMEQIYESPNMTEKQRALSSTPTRTFVTPMQNNRWNNECERENPNRVDQQLKTTLQQSSNINTLSEGICQFTLPSRPDLFAGDVIQIIVGETGAQSSGESDKKFSGRWVIASLAHHYMMEANGCYTKLTCVRSSNQQTEEQSF